MSKIIIDRDLLEQALKAFRQIAWSNDSEWQADCANESALKLRAALEQPQVELTSVEQYQLQMAAISTAAMGYWKEGDSIHPDYDTPSLRDVAKLYASKQPPRQPLTDDEIEKLFPYTHEWLYEIGLEEATKFARSIEAAHGIGG